MNYYELLNVSKDADNNEIKKQYYKLAKEYHPDKTKGNKDKESKFIQIQQAYDTLIDEDKLKSYNMTMYEDELLIILPIFSLMTITQNKRVGKNLQDFHILNIDISEYLNGIHRMKAVMKNYTYVIKRG